TPYFPFVQVAWLPDPPAGHLGSEDPFGVIPNIPFALLAVVALVLAFRKAPWDPRLRWLCIAIAASVVGTGLATTSFGGAINRYEVDFLPGVIVLACVAWLWISDGGLRGAAGTAAGIAIALALAFSAAFNVLASIRHNDLFLAEHPQMYHRLVHAGNWIPQKLDEWLGTRYGPIELKVVFPQDRVGRTEPLVVTGCSFLSDVLSVHYDRPGFVSFGLLHSAYGNFTGPSVAAAPGAVHTIQVEMGSLYPPPSHPFFDSLTPAEAELCQKTLRVTIDGNLALQRDIPFFDSASRQPRIGNSGGRPEFPEPFSGRIVFWRRLPIDLIQAAQGPVTLSVVFPVFTGVRSEPLVSTGVPGQGDLLYVRYEDPDTISLGVDHWRNGSKLSSPIRVDYGAVHSIEVDAASLSGPKGAVGTELVGPFAVRLDGRTIFSEQAPYSACAMQTVTAGINRAGSSASGGMFRGQMMETRGTAADGVSGHMARFGAVELDFRMPAAAVHAQPLVTTGRPGLGDALFIRWSRPGFVRLGYDHWGSGLVESADIALTADCEHLMTVEMPSLLAPGSTPEERRCRQGVVVRIDGGLAWARHVLFHEALPTEAYVGSNGIESSSCERDFSGGIVWFDRRPVPPVNSVGTGPVSLSLVLPQDREGLREPLLALGRTGRADVLIIRYLDGHHVGFAIDHWGVSYTQSQPVEVDYGRLHDLQIEMPGLQPSGSAAVKTGEAVVRLDGSIVWRISQEFYETDSRPDIAVNRIGASTCEAQFTGVLVGISRR
ncbi:MAG TPA: hypothetical protein VII43_01145, partial [Opitutaceae bacterium]